MELDFSSKNLVSFDASYLGKGAEKPINASLFSAGGGGAGEDASTLSTLLERAPIVKGINLSRNTIHMFVGGETLRHVVHLDLSRNALSVLNTNSLPPFLVKLNVAHNNLQALDNLAAHVPALQELNISSNGFTAAGLRGFPSSLVNLQAQENEVALLDALRPLKRLARLNLSANRLDTVESLQGLRDLPCLHHLELRGNGVYADAAASFGVSEEIGICRALMEVAPHLFTLDGQPLSQAPGNRKFKTTRAASAKASLNGSVRSPPQLGSGNTSTQPPRLEARGRGRGTPVAKDSHSHLNRSYNEESRLTRSTADRTASPHASRTLPARKKSQQAMEVRLMEAKVAELRRLLTESEKKENQERYERGILMDQIKSCAGVIDAQASELYSLQTEISELEKEEQSLRESLAAVDQAFEQTHASIIAQKVELLGSPQDPAK